MLGLDVGAVQIADQAQVTFYTESIKNSYTSAVGGEYTPGMTLAKWSDSLKGNLIPIDREGDLISSLFLSRNFPNFDSASIRSASLMVEEAIKTYLLANTVNGCTDISSINYQPYANNQEPAQSCDEHIKFGGIISSQFNATWCRDQDNILTNAKFCAQGYVKKVS